MAEHLFCKQDVAGPIPALGSQNGKHDLCWDKPLIAVRFCGRAQKAYVHQIIYTEHSIYMTEASKDIISSPPAAYTSTSVETFRQLNANLAPEQRYRIEHQLIVQEFKEYCQPDPETVVYTCIPSRADLTHFFVFLESTIKQGKIWPREHVVLVGINSHRNDQVAYEKYTNDPTSLNPEEIKQNQAREDNILEDIIINEIHYSQSPARPEQKVSFDNRIDRIAQAFAGHQRLLTDRQRQIIRTAMERRVRIEAISIMHSHGKEIDEIAVPPWVRNILGHIAQERAWGNYALIDYLDADCFLPSTYSKELIALAHHQPSLVVKQLVLYPGIETPPQIAREPQNQRLMTLMKYLTSYSQTAKQFTRDTDTQLPPNTFLHTSAYAPTIAVSSKLFQNNGGYKYYRVGSSGDFTFGKEVSGLVLNNDLLVQFLPHPVYMSDREGLVDGSRRGRPANSETTITTLLRSFKTHYLSEASSILGSVYRLDQYMQTTYGHVYEEIKEMEFRTMRMQQEYRRQSLKKIIDVATALYEQNPNDQAFFIEGLKQQQNIRFQDFAKRNEILLATLWDVFVFVSTDKKIQKLLPITNQTPLEDAVFTFYETFLPQLVGKTESIVIPTDIKSLKTQIMDFNNFVDTLEVQSLNKKKLNKYEYISLLKKIFNLMKQIPPLNVFRPVVNAAWTCTAEDINNKNLAHEAQKNRSKEEEEKSGLRKLFHL